MQYNIVFAQDILYCLVDLLFYIALITGETVYSVRSFGYCLVFPGCANVLMCKIIEFQGGLLRETP